jgi:hypothetical protein
MPLHFRCVAPLLGSWEKENALGLIQVPEIDFLYREN